MSIDDFSHLSCMTFDVYGMPGPQGSKSFKGVSKRTSKGIMVESSQKVKPWREAVKWAAREAMATYSKQKLLQTPQVFPIDAPIRVQMIFTLPKPSGAPKTRKTWPMRKPDGSKLQRSTEDALTDAGLWADDARAVEWSGAKRFPNEGVDALPSPGVRIRIQILTEQDT